MFEKVFVLALLAVAATATPAYHALDASTSNNLNFGQAIYEFMTAFQSIMPCGYAPEDIPVLAPFTLAQQDFSFVGKEYSFVGNVSNLMITGLNNFRVIGGAFDESTQRASFDMIFSGIQILGEYELDSYVSLGGYPWRTHQRGLINEKFVDLRFVGAYTLSTKDKGLQLNDLKLNFYLGDIELSNWNDMWNISTNNFANRWVRELLLMVAQQIQPDVVNIYDAMVLPLYNDMLAGVNMSQIIDFFNSQAQIWNNANCQVVA